MNEAALAAVARAVFAADGGMAADPAYVLPADVPLELSGEAVRARLCVFSDDHGREWALRPDLTLPLALEEAGRRRAGGAGAAAYHYAARAFRLPARAGEATEFTQVGFERFGFAATPEADAGTLALAWDAVTACGVSPDVVATGDLAIVPAFIDALGLPAVTAGLLKAAFRQEGGMRAVLETPLKAPDPELGPVLEAADPEAALLALLSARGIPIAGTRSPAEIVAGLKAQAAFVAAGGIPHTARELLLALRDIDCPLEEAPARLSQLAAKAGLPGTEAAIARLAERNAAIAARLPAAPGRAHFRSGFGRRFTYYDGFLFELQAGALGADQPVAAGGRYDGLISELTSGVVEATAIGAVVRPDRLLRLRSKNA